MKGPEADFELRPLRCTQGDNVVFDDSTVLTCLPAYPLTHRR